MLQLVYVYLIKPVASLKFYQSCNKVPYEKLPNSYDRPEEDRERFEKKCQLWDVLIYLKAQENCVSYDFGQLVDKNNVVREEGHLVVGVVSFVEDVADHG